MSLSIFGVLVVAVCGYLTLMRSPLSVLTAVMLFTLLGGAAAINLSALGDSSVRPALLATVLLSASVCMPGPKRFVLMPGAIVNNFPLVVFCIYGAATAFILPVLFVGDFQVVPLNPRGLTTRFGTAPLHFTNQNITTAFYLLATMMAALSAWIAVQQKAAPRILVMTIVAIGLIHSAFGVADIVLTGTPLESVLSFFRNANYAQHNQGINGFIRVNGIFPEPSVYATYALTWFVCCFEFWLRNIWPRVTGPTAVLLFFMLVLSLSSTAFVGLAAYGAIIVTRGVLHPAMFRTKLLPTASLGVCAITVAGLALAILKPSLMQSVADTFLALTVEKGASDSGEERLFWAKQGINFFVATYGAGIGAGSFRSSSLITAIMGSSGIIGLVTFAWFLLSALKPLSLSTYIPACDARMNIGASLAWGAVGIFIPASITYASADPGIIFGILAGASIGLRGTPTGVAYPNRLTMNSAFAVNAGR